MGQVDGKMNTCDRCGKALFVANSQSSSESSNWRTIQRYTVDGTPVTRFVCLDCVNDYKNEFTREDQAFNRFMENKSSEEEQE